MKLTTALTKISLAIALSLSVNAFASSDSAQAAYKAKLVNDQVIAFNGKYSYVIDPSGLRETINALGLVVVKIYGTEIWLTIDKNGIAMIQKGRLKNMAYYVLAPLKNMDTSKDGSVDYKKFAVGYASSNSVTFPATFCSSCAAPTTMDEKTTDVIRELFSQAEAGELTMASHKLGSL